MSDSSENMPAPLASDSSVRRRLERGIVAIFSDLAELFGSPPSIGEIYGLLFSSERPLSMEEIIDRLGISKGSASQGLRHLTELGAVHMISMDDDRRRHYRAEIEIRRLIMGFIQERLIPHLDKGEKSLKCIEMLLPDLPAEYLPTGQARIERLSRWHQRGAMALPLALQLLPRD
jgi:HTH-type transcriptional regulator, glycine betaine synthesis regulator